MTELTLEEACRSLQDAGFRLTRPRQAVVETIISRDRNFTVAEVLADVEGRDRSVGRATVFRTLDLMVSLGMVGRARHPDGGLGYVLCPRGHHHHAVCSQCGLVVDLPGCPLGLEEAREAKDAGFQLNGHHLEYYGLCRECQNGKEEAS